MIAQRPPSGADHDLEALPPELHEVTAALRRVVADLHRVIDAAPPTSWALLDDALRHALGALLTLRDVPVAPPRAPAGEIDLRSGDPQVSPS